MNVITKNLKNSFKVLIITFVVASCTEPMDLDLDSTYARLVVEGAFTTDTGIHRIRLSTTTDFYYKATPPAVSGAHVTISSGNELYELTENPSGSGIYETQDGVFGQVGKTYSLKIELLQELGGHKLYAASSLLRPTAEPDSIQVVFQPTWGQGFWEIKLYAQDPPTQDFYKFLTYVNGTLVTDTLYEIFVVDDRFFNGRYTNGVGVSFLNSEVEDNRLNPGDTVTLLMANITDEYHHFILTARIESGFNTPLFSGPPANVKSNVNNGAIGFFAVYQPRYVSRIYNGE